MREIRRRQFLISTGTLLAAPLLNAQPAQSRSRIGILLVGSEANMKPLYQALIEGLHDRGHVVGKNLIADFRYDNGENLQAIAEELIALKPNVLAGAEITSVVMKAKTSTIPIVMLNSADPVAAGLVKSLARPGTNVTGLSYSMIELVAKQVQLLTEIVPKMSRVALLTAPFDPPKDSPYFGRQDAWELAARQAADAKGLSLFVARASDSESLRAAFATLKSQRIEGLLVATNSLVLHLHKEIMDEVMKLRLPAISGYATFARDGGLLSYGLNYNAMYRYAAKFVDLVLKGARPADIPVEQASQFELLCNEKTAQALGLKISPSILIRVDRMLQ